MCTVVAVAVCASSVRATVTSRDEAVQVDTCDPRFITSSDDAGCGRFFPRFHPKNAKPLAHNNDANAPFEYKGVSHLFMQASFPGVDGWNGEPPALGQQRLDIGQLVGSF